MSSFEKQFAEIVSHLEDTTSGERNLVRELEEALVNADNQIQEEIDRLQKSHVLRRENIAASLVGLARQIGHLPMPSGAASQFDYLPVQDAPAVIEEAPKKRQEAPHAEPSVRPSQTLQEPVQQDYEPAPVDDPRAVETISKFAEKLREKEVQVG